MDCAENSVNKTKSDKFKFFEAFFNYKLKPTAVIDKFWINAVNCDFPYQKHTKDGGKWLVFIKKVFVDECWLTVKKALFDGKLGRHAKVSTSKPNNLKSKKGVSVICVYTYDYSDKNDVQRIKNEILKLNLPLVYEKLFYETDKDADKCIDYDHKNKSVDTVVNKNNKSLLKKRKEGFETINYHQTQTSSGGFNKCR